MKSVPAAHTQPRPLHTRHAQTVGGVADDPQGLLVNLFAEAC